MNLPVLPDRSLKLPTQIQSLTRFTPSSFLIHHNCELMWIVSAWRLWVLILARQWSHSVSISVVATSMTPSRRARFVVFTFSRAPIAAQIKPSSAAFMCATALANSFHCLNSSASARFQAQESSIALISFAQSKLRVHRLLARARVRPSMGFRRFSRLRICRAWGMTGLAFPERK